LTPLLGIGLCVSIQFAGLEYSKRLFSARNVASGVGDGSLTGSQYFASGVIAGLANSVVSGPVEHIRIREYFFVQRMIGGSLPSAASRIYASPSLNTGLQTQPDKARLYAGPWDAFKKMYAAKGIAGIYKGQVATLYREASGYGVYFWTYEKLMEREMTQKGIRRDQVNPAKTILFGAASGYTVRACSYVVSIPRTLLLKFFFVFEL
jgi:solute carrier family 25 carnitine/acylcarnitine transporter 20/29